MLEPEKVFDQSQIICDLLKWQFFSNGHGISSIVFPPSSCVSITRQRQSGSEHISVFFNRDSPVFRKLAPGHLRTSDYSVLEKDCHRCNQ